MNPTTTDLDSFEAALLQDLRDEVALRGSAPMSAPREIRADAPPTVASRSVRRRRSILATAVAAAATAAAWVTVPTPGASPAYAVSATTDGNVTVTVDRLEDAAGLQAALREHGISAVVDFLPGGMVCRDEGRYAQASSDHRGLLSTSIQGSSLTFSIPRNWLAPSETLVISLSTSPSPGEHDTVFAMGFGVAEGPVGQCEPAPFPQVVVESGA
jgi:hypothetical protein